MMAARVSRAEVCAALKPVVWQICATAVLVMADEKSDDAKSGDLDSVDFDFDFDFIVWLIGWFWKSDAICSKEFWVQNPNPSFIYFPY